MISKWSTAAIAAVMGMAGGVNAANYCGDLTNAYGPFDYRTRSEHVDSFNLVEHAHFTPEVEAGIKTVTATSEVGGDLDYTLRAIPNHPRALAAMARFARRTKSVQLPYAKWPVECYFNRAMRMAPDDGAVYGEYGNYLFGLGKSEKAFTMYREAVRLSPENAAINYNAALAYFSHKDYDNALTHAQKAYSLGYPLPGLKKKLIEAGKWVEPSPPPADAAPAVAPPTGETPVPVAPADKPAG